MSYHKLSENVDESFGFELLPDRAFNMRYPLAGEMEDLRDINIQLDAATKSGDEAKAKELAAKLEAYLYGLITPIGHDEPIDEVMKRVSVPIMRHFNKMIQEELSI